MKYFFNYLITKSRNSSFEHLTVIQTQAPATNDKRITSPEPGSVRSIEYTFIYKIFH